MTFRMAASRSSEQFSQARPIPTADFRFAAQSDWEAIYKLEHGAPQLLSQFLCALPEHVGETDVAHVGHPDLYPILASTQATSSGYENASALAQPTTRRPRLPTARCNSTTAG